MVSPCHLLPVLAPGIETDALGGNCRRDLITMKASEFDRTFDAGADVSGQVDWSNAKRPNEQAKRVNVDFPAWVVAGLDRQARHLGVTRQALIKLWIAERLQRSGNRT